MQLIDFSLAVLAVWRITHLLSKEDGPFGIIFLIRKKAGAGFFGNLLDCFYCLSLWTSIPFAYSGGFGWKQILLWWLALSGAACLLERATSRNNTDLKKPFYSED